MTPDPEWSAVSLNDARTLIDMTSRQEGGAWKAIAEEQLKGAVDLYARLGSRHVAWLCDEVGLGKTYVAMAVAALVRRQQPDARILYLLPSSRLLPKWSRELALFSRRNVKEVDHRLRTLQERPARPLVPVDTLHRLALETTLDPDRDFLCTLGAFSFGLPAQERAWRTAWEQLLRLLPPGGREGLAWEDLEGLTEDLEPRTDGLTEDERKLQVKVAVAEVINRILPDFDLVICDESHNLRHGLRSGAARNRLLSVSLGGVYCHADEKRGELPVPVGLGTPLRRRARRVLMLTATPFRAEFSELSRQAAVFGFVRQGGEIPPVVAELEHLRPPRSGEQRTAAELADLRDKTVRDLVVRRLGTLTVNKEERSRNQYRTELREGGMDRRRFDDAMPAPGVRERLLLALVQKRVLDVLQPKEDSAGWRFQMGLLSSFESFGQTLDRTEADASRPPSHEGESTDEGRSTAEREAHALDSLIASYQDAFGERMPHPKLNQVAKALAKEAWCNGEKALVFVRRVKTTEELATRVTWHYDDLLERWIRAQLPPTPELRGDWAHVWRSFNAYRRRFRLPTRAKTTESARSLFGWYFRHHKADPGEVEAVGGALAAGGLEASRPWAVLLEDNPVLVLFGHDEDKLAAWAREPTRAQELVERAQEYAFINQSDGSIVKKRRPGAAAWFLAYQAAALDRIAEESGGDPERARLAHALRTLRFPVRRPPGKRIAEANKPHGEPAHWLVLPTLFSELQRRESAALRKQIWNSKTLDDLQHAASGTDPGGSTSADGMLAALLERDRRQAVLAQLLRSGRSYLDLWLAVVQVQGSMKRDKVRLNYDDTTAAQQADFLPTVIQPKLQQLSTALVARLKAGRPDRNPEDAVDSPGRPLTAWMELARVCKHFPLLQTLNFPRLEEVDPASARGMLRTTLTGLEPAIALHGSSKTRRALEQFRMPGFPVVLVATSVVQEGVDLHTFCRKVVHYGIDGSATGTEQRNGRVDRRGSLISRLIERNPEETIDVYFPHLRQSLEPLQMAALFQKMNRFLVMANKLGADTVSEQQDVLCAMSQQLDHPDRYPEPYQEKLETAFPAVPPLPEHCAPLAPAGDALVVPDGPPVAPETEGVHFSDVVQEGAKLRWRTTAILPAAGESDRTQPLVLEVDSGRDPGFATLVLDSPVWPFDVDVYQKKKRDTAPMALVTLAAVLRNWSRPAGVHLFTRRRSRTRINLYLRSEVPLGSGTSDRAALTTWAYRVASIADELEQLLARAIGEDDTKDHTDRDFQ